MRGTRHELSTVGFDENLQIVGSDPYGSPYWVGQRIPATPPPNGSRYLFLLALARFGAHTKGRLVGMRQLVTIGQNIPVFVSTTIAPASNGQALPQAVINVASTAGFPPGGTALVTTSSGVQVVSYTGITPTSITGAAGGVGVMSTGGLVQVVVANYPLELDVRSPFWKFVDGNISWHLRRVPPMYQNVTANLGNAESMQFLYGQTPALLFQQTPSDVGGYVPPYGGQPPGNILVPDLATFHDLRFHWKSDRAWESIDVEIEGPCDVALFASVKQTTVSGVSARTPLIIPPGVPLGSLQREDAFISVPADPGNPQQQVGPAPNAVYWRVAGSLIFEEENFIRVPLQLNESRMEESPLCRNNDGGRGDGGSDGDGGGDPNPSGSEDRQGSHGEVAGTERKRISRRKGSR